MFASQDQPSHAPVARKIQMTMAAVVLGGGALLLSGCGAEGASPAASSASASGLASVDGRAEKVNSKEIVLRTVNGTQTFKIRPEDEAGVGPEHVESHMGIPSIGFKVYYVTDNGVDYAVSAEEIKGDTLGFK
ncbi:MAG: hypothetical protein HQ526_09575 [Actinobacteria bacterium]|nr:hypothetical protein [Actinomycetota bacterium]